MRKKNDAQQDRPYARCARYDLRHLSAEDERAVMAAILGCTPEELDELLARHRTDSDRET